MWAVRIMEDVCVVVVKMEKRTYSISAEVNDHG
jgi:hypothetical protein